MARFPEADWMPLDRYKPGGSSHTSMTPRRLIFHTAVSNSSSLFHSMNTPGTPSSHFYLRENGTYEQYIDTEARSSANLDGNYDCITVESWDGYGTGWQGSNVPDWTEAQAAACVRLILWCNREHGIPIEVLPDSEGGRRGVGWHRLGIDGNFPPGVLHGRRAGTETWSSSAGKACPGDRKILSLANKLIPAAAAGGTEEIDMQMDDRVPGAAGQTVGDALKASLVTNRWVGKLREAEAARNAEERDTLAAILSALDNEPSLPDVRRAVRDIVHPRQQAILARLDTLVPDNDEPEPPAAA